MVFRKIRRKSHLLSSFEFRFLVVVSLLTYCSAWVPEDCPNFCECFWLYGLKWADCTGHRLYSVQTGVDENVQALDLSNNSISSLANYELRDAGLTRLKLINLSSNAISEIGLTAFVGVPHLRVLDLSKNHLYYILPDTFVDNKKLEVLELAGNNLNQHVPMLRSSSLGSLNFANCGISHLPLKTFDGLPRLRALDLSGNNMIQFELDILRDLPNLAVLVIERNPWSCNKDIHELQKRLKARRIIFKEVCNDDKSPDSNNVPKKFEKMIVLENPTTSRPCGSSGRLLATIKNRKSDSGLEKSSNRWESYVKSTETPTSDSLDTTLLGASFVIGFLVGSAISTCCTYFWLTRSFTASLSSLRRQAAPPNDNTNVVNQRANLLQHLCQNNEDANRSTTNCPGTPPPPYRDVILHANRYPTPHFYDANVFPNDESIDERENRT